MCCICRGGLWGRGRLLGLIDDDDDVNKGLGGGEEGLDMSERNERASSYPGMDGWLEMKKKKNNMEFRGWWFSPFRKVLLSALFSPETTGRKGCIKSMPQKTKTPIQANLLTHQLPSKIHQSQLLPRQKFLALSS